MSGTILIYGATGYTGKLIAKAAADAGARPILAGRPPAARERASTAKVRPSQSSSSGSRTVSRSRSSSGTTGLDRLRRCGRALNEKNSVSSMSRIFAARLVVATALAVMALSALFVALRMLE